MDFASISWPAVLISAVLFFLIGGLWYGAVFGKLWLRLVGLTQEQTAASNMPLLYGGTLGLELLAAIGLAAAIGGDATVGSGVLTGLAVGVLIAAAVLGVQALYDRKPPALYLLNAGYNVVGFAAMGAVIGALQ